MGLIDRYLTKIYLRNIALASAALAFILLFQGMFADLLDPHFEPRQVVIYHLLNLPQVFVQMLPPAILVATVITLSGLSKTNELIAIHSIGIGITRITSLLLSLVVIVSSLNLVLVDRVLPAAFKKRTTYYRRVMKKQDDFFLDFRKDKIWYRSRNLIYNLQRFDPVNDHIVGMSVYTFDDAFNLIQVTEAKYAEFKGRSWHLRDGTVTVYDRSEQGGFPSSQRFVEKELPIAETPRDFREIEKEVDGLRLRELYQYFGRLREAGGESRDYEVKFHGRIAMAMSPIVMAVLGVPFSIRRRREGGMGKDLALCLGFTGFYWFFLSVGLSMGKNGTVTPWIAAWFPSLIFGALAGILLARKHG